MQLAFVNDQDAPDSKDGSSAGLDSIADSSLDSVETSLLMSRTQSPEGAKSSINEDASIPWWHRDPGASYSFRSDGSGSREGSYYEDGGVVGVDMGSGGGSLDYGRNAVVATNERTSGREVHAQDAPNFRASSVLVRLPGMSPPPTPTSGSPTTPFNWIDQGSVSMSRSAPSQRTLASGASVQGGLNRGGGEAPRRPVSPATISYAANRGAPPHGHPAGRPASSHYPHMTASHSCDQITDLTALNDILLGPECEDPHLIAAAQARAMAAAASAAERDGEDPHLFATAQARAVAAAAAVAADRDPYYNRPKSVTLAALDASASRAIAAQRYDNAYSCEDGEHGNGRLPSIAGLVAAGAFLSNDKWRPFRPPGSFRVRDSANEV